MVSTRRRVASFAFGIQSACRPGPRIATSRPSFQTRARWERARVRTETEARNAGESRSSSSAGWRTTGSRVETTSSRSSSRPRRRETSVRRQRRCVPEGRTATSRPRRNRSPRSWRRMRWVEDMGFLSVMRRSRWDAAGMPLGCRTVGEWGAWERRRRRRQNENRPGSVPRRRASVGR